MHFCILTDLKYASIDFTRDISYLLESSINKFSIFLHYHNYILDNLCNTIVNIFTI